MSEILTIPFAFPGIPGVRCLFTTRRGGRSTQPFDQANLSLQVGDDPAEVLENRRLLARQAGVEKWCELKQVHGDLVLVDPVPSSTDKGPSTDGDGMATTAPGQALVIKTADCQPVLLAHKGGRHVMALHVGWRGNVLDMPGRGVAVFCRAYGLDPADILAVRGPSLSPAEAEFVNFDQEFGPAFARFHDPATRTVDLWTLTRMQLVEAGLSLGNVFGVDLCTRSLADLFFSYRRDRRTGRQAGMIWIDG